MGTVVLAGNYFGAILRALEEEEVEIQSVVVEAFPLPGAFHCAGEELTKGRWEAGLEAALVQRWGWERAREERNETGRVGGEWDKGREVREGRIWAEMPKGPQLGWDGTGDAVTGTKWEGDKCVPGSIWRGSREQGSGTVAYGC